MAVGCSKKTRTLRRRTYRPRAPGLENCLAEARTVIQRNFGEPTILEHGRCEPSTSLGCGIDHLHLHVAALQFSLGEAVNHLFPATEWQPIANLSETEALFEEKIGYALVHEPGEQMYCPAPARSEAALSACDCLKVGAVGAI